MPFTILLLEKIKDFFVWIIASIIFCVCIFLLINQDVIYNFLQLQISHMSPMQSVLVVPKLELIFQNLKINKPNDIILSLKDDEGKAIQGILPEHERLLHIFIVSENFQFFSHIHIEDFGLITLKMLEEAKFPIRYSFPQPGKYLVAVNFTVNHQHFFKQAFLKVTGQHSSLNLEKDNSFEEDKIPNYQINFSHFPNLIQAQKEVTLDYFINKNGKKVTDIVPYLDAPMHITAISSDLQNIIHTHAHDKSAKSLHMGHNASLHDRTHNSEAMVDKFGPNLEASVTFPDRGTYHVFGEMRHQEKIVVVESLVEVN
ncbi:hypothetical protein WA1_28175 [Scytonema hofmannii PCC 7110]|uniref:Uncharacterized protein n=1 Tax=Scytonema hofmannii PCC 7110 TaxID=128403 RepID=A0A139X562_9CYAN|nr:hypothetical protein [Scytonema hofmannii]KYC39849.1 hypothetical protein WA1_28175 [Scytonema hofmannii PCC 7110]